MISVSDALDLLFDLAEPLGDETVALRQAAGRVMAHPAQARRDQPPFAGSAMDGYAVRADEAKIGATFTVIGESAAGHGFGGSVGSGEALRIFTGAPVPEGADRVIIQEDITRDGDRITITDNPGTNPHIRLKGADFVVGQELSAPRLLRPAHVALLAAMNIAEITATRRPKVAILATGDELVMPGETPGPDQIIASNNFGLKGMLEELGAEVHMLPIARDSVASLEMAFSLVGDADLLLTIGGASVGDHDLVGRVAADLGMQRAFYKIAMRPGKPLMAGRLKSGAMMIGLPGNPVSAMVCGHVFVAPVIRAMLGLGQSAQDRRTAVLGEQIPPNGPREHYMRARVDNGTITVFANQDSSLLTVLADANALLIRPPSDGTRDIGDTVKYLAI